LVDGVKNSRPHPKPKYGCPTSLGLPAYLMLREIELKCWSSKLVSGTDASAGVYKYITNRCQRERLS